MDRAELTKRIHAVFRDVPRPDWAAKIAEIVMANFTTRAELDAIREQLTAEKNANEQLQRELSAARIRIDEIERKP